MLAYRFPMISPPKRRQRGAILLIMLVIMVIGALALFVSSLNSSNPQISRNKETADALAKAKEALIARAVADLTSPGSLPCPDADGDGSADLFSGNQCPYYIGKLPWKTLGLPDLRDGSGEELWYAVSPNFRDFASANPINSDTQGTLNITGTTTASNVIAIVFSAGNVLSGQDRSSTPAACTTTGTSIAANLCATNYLEGSNANLSTAATPNTAYQTAASSSTFNDQMIYITHEQLFAPVEIRIAREAKKCLDDYAAVDGSKYPWAADATGITTQFGWFPDTPNTDTSPGGSVTGGSYGNSSAQTLADALTALQNAIDAYNASGTSTNKSALNTAANTVIGLKYSVTGVSSSTIDTAGDFGKDFANGITTYTTASGKVTDTFTALNAVYPPLSVDSSMPNTSWSSIPTCNTLINGSYWANWKQSVFYQISSGYEPGSSASCTTTTAPYCIKVNGSGSTGPGNHNDYRAVVIVGRQALLGQTQPSTSMTDYLDGNNQSPGSAPPTFETYQTSDNTSAPNNYSNINDLVVCADGNNYCQ
jgi:hypothetical protein